MAIKQIVPFIFLMQYVPRLGALIPMEMPRITYVYSQSTDSQKGLKITYWSHIHLANIKA